ncbi:cache domain-containing protein [Ideonella sp. B7]|uniref:cache domain-containing protein n=1 Tax=Ideonella benzenivorans TaxID=2831643 RepID=UPI001CED4353|nr:cache domain-containing protein [Ideonella benzenivorans]MCA6218473.1 cache domain-containing protein [Ideonella benzenivorans]
MRLRLKLVLLAAVPLLLSVALIAAAVHHQERALAQREQALVQQAYMAARQSELKHYVDLAVSTIRPLYERRHQDPQAQAEALRLLASLDYGSDGYFFVYNLQGRVLMHSRQPELLGRNLWGLRDPHGQPTIQQLIAQARAGGGFVTYPWHKPSSGQMVPKLGYVVALPDWNWMIGTGLYLDDIQTTLTALDGQVSRHITTTLLWITGIAMAGLGLLSASGLWLNLSEHRVADAKLGLLARQVVRSQESERAHLARELHDGTSQTLVSAKLMVESAVDALERAGTPPPPALGKALERLNDALGEVRDLSHRLRPAMLDTLGLPAALAWLGHEFGEHGPAQVRLQLDEPEPALPDEAGTVLFRVAQEALANIGKHAQARRVSLTLDAQAGGVCLEIRDDGRGFDLDAVQQDPRRGIGLRNMRERLESIDGTLTLRSAPGQGTTLWARVPAAALARLAASTPAGA